MPNLRIAPINFHDQSTVTASSELGDMVAANTQNVARGLVWRFANSFPVTLECVLPSTRRVNCFGVFRHDLIGRKVRLETFSDNAFSTPTYDSTALAVPGPIAGSYDWGYDPDVTNSKYDPIHSEAAYGLYFSPAATQSYRITVTNDTGSATYNDVCRFFLGSYVEMEINPEPGTNLSLGYLSNSDQVRTYGGSLQTNPKSRWRTMSFNLAMVFEGQRSVLLDMMAICELRRDLMVSLHPEEGDRLERDYYMNAKFGSLDAITRDYSFSTKKIVFEEV